jgi:FlaA1/EpsC-like NDP-sugar epimerase
MLDMGKPVRILDLASHMITMAGLLPGVDIRIEFSGLRRGEKMTEEIMTEEEEQTQIVRDRIYTVKSPPPRLDLADRLMELRRLAEACDGAGILENLRDLVPTYRPSSAGGLATVMAADGMARPGNEIH